MDSNLSVNQHLFDSSLSGINPEPELNKNLYNIFVPFYANLLNNQLIQTSQKSLMADKMSHLLQINQVRDYLQEKFKKPVIEDIYDPIQRSLSKTVNWGQLSKAQNLRRILNRIHYNKGIQETTLHQNNLPTIVPNVQAHPKEIHCKDKVPAFKSPEAKNFDTCPPNGTIGNKTVRQLLEERQTFIKKLKQNELELIGRINTKGQIENNVQAQLGNITSFKIPEMIQIKKSPTLNKHNIASHNMTGAMPHSPRSSDLINNQRNRVHQDYSAGFGYTVSPPKKNPTVRQLLEIYRKSHKSNDKSPGGMKLSKINRRSHPYHDKSSRLLPSNVRKNNLKKMLDTIGSDPNNPIVLSGDESDDCSVISCNSSSIRTEHSISSESSQRLSDSYNLYSEHNYVMSPELTLQAKQVIIDLNRHLSAEPPKQSSIEQDQNLSCLTEQQKVEMFLNLEKNHSNYSGEIFIKNLNLIKSKDMRRKPIAYLNAKYPLNQISRSIYAGIDTKKAVLDFPKPKHQVNLGNQFESPSKHKILDKSHEIVSDKRVSNNWSEVLENLDFSSPLSQKIIGVVPKYQLKN